MCRCGFTLAALTVWQCPVAQELIRKLILTAVVVLMDSGTPLQITIAVVVSGWAHVLHASFKPWKTWRRPSSPREDGPQTTISNGVDAMYSPEGAQLIDKGSGVATDRAGPDHDAHDGDAGAFHGDRVYAVQHGSLFVTSFVLLMGLLFKVDGVSTSSATYSSLSYVMVVMCVSFIVFWLLSLVAEVAARRRKRVRVTSSVVDADGGDDSLRDVTTAVDDGGDEVGVSFHDEEGGGAAEGAAAGRAREEKGAAAGAAAVGRAREERGAAAGGLGGVALGGVRRSVDTPVDSSGVGGAMSPSGVGVGVGVSRGATRGDSVPRDDSPVLMDSKDDPWTERGEQERQSQWDVQRDEHRRRNYVVGGVGEGVAGVGVPLVQPSVGGAVDGGWHVSDVNASPVASNAARGRRTGSEHAGNARSAV